MLAIFRQEVANPPPELNSPAPKDRRPKQPDQILAAFLESDPHNAFSTMFGDSAALAYIRSPSKLPYRLFCGMDDIYCLFLGSLSNLSSLIRQYGLSKTTTNEPLLVIEAYRTLRDRGPYPADQVVKDFLGHYAFVLFDRKSATVFTALCSDGEMQLYWGVAADGSVVISDNVDVVKQGCVKSFAPFPAGCMFHSSGGGLQSFEHPMNKMKAMPRVDSEGVLCGASFKVDVYSRTNSIPRVGSATNWAPWSSQ